MQWCMQLAEVAPECLLFILPFIFNVINQPLHQYMTVKSYQFNVSRLIVLNIIKDWLFWQRNHTFAELCRILSQFELLTVTLTESENSACHSHSHCTYAKVHKLRREHHKQHSPSLLLLSLIKCPPSSSWRFWHCWCMPLGLFVFP